MKLGSPKILLIDGARQVGKTYIIRHVGEKLFSNYIEINMVEDSLGARLFAETKSVEDFYLQVSMLHGDKLKQKENTLNELTDAVEMYVFRWDRCFSIYKDIFNTDEMQVEARKLIDQMQKYVDEKLEELNERKRNL